MQKLRIAVLILTVVSIVASVLLWFRSVKMNVKPEIHCTVEGDINVPSNVTDAQLLKYVTATDSKDGDISDRIIVERKNYFISQGLTSINYAVCDSDNNVAKIEKHVRFTDYRPPRFSLKSDFIAYVRTTVDFSNFVEAYDVYDGDITDRVKIISSTYSVAYTGEYEVNCKVTNSFGDTSEISFNAIVVDDDPDVKKVKLKDYIIYTTVGNEIDFSANISDAYQLDNGRTLTIDTEELEINTPGVYSVYYKVDELVRGRVVVVVEEAQG
ncbi:MAG: hypothetical protein IKZ59_01340 [Clostridia bacterium]|nr:hypothetical protein [Clostridia bacterium]